MKKISSILAAIMLAVLPIKAQQVTEDNFHQLTVHYSTPELRLSKTIIDGVNYSTLQIDGYTVGGEIGAPALPMLTSLITIPFCEKMEISVEHAIYDTVTLPADADIFPMQPSRSKQDTSRHEIILNGKTYSTPGFQGNTASVEAIGVGRDRNYAQLRFSPVQVDLMQNKAVVCRSADITVRYFGADEERTIDVFSRYHTPAFSLGSTLNTLISAPKAENDVSPLRMVIMAPEILQCQALSDFATWKRTQGMIVDLVYVASGMTATTIADTLQSMYDNATDDAPAPSYLLLVGDVAQMPIFNSRLEDGGWYGPDNDHITDLYYTTWTLGDYLPDCYWGRFSCTDTSSLNSIIDKTMYYENYGFSDDEYLTRGILIAGVDRGYSGDNGYEYADPTMDYAAYFYVNATNGFNDVSYYKNNTSYAPDGVTVTGSSQASTAAATLRTLYNDGAGWINYSAHGDWNNWSSPLFNVSNISRMSNNGKPSMMIGNCCLTNKFEKDVCFGEALLRKTNRAGAVAYIGGTNYTYWGEDFSWSVGIRNNVSNTMSPAYDSTQMGMYDHLFHTHGEPISEWMVTAGKMVLSGNMSVENSTSSLKQYYWEIYQLMGDPSLLPWLGKAATMQATAAINVNLMEVQAVPGAYVALVQNGTLQALSAAFAGTDGRVYLNIPSGIDAHDCFVSITAQGYKPTHITSSQMGLNEVDASEAKIAPNPATNRCQVEAAGLKRVTLFNVMGQPINTVTASNDQCTLSLTGVPAGIYLIKIESLSGTSMKKLIVK